MEVTYQEGNNQSIFKLTNPTITDEKMLKNLLGTSSLADLDMCALENLEEIHHAGLRKVGIAKVSLRFCIAPQCNPLVMGSEMAFT